VASAEAPRADRSGGCSPASDGTLRLDIRVDHFHSRRRVLSPDARSRLHDARLKVGVRQCLLGAVPCGLDRCAARPPQRWPVHLLVLGGRHDRPPSSGSHNVNIYRKRSCGVTSPAATSFGDLPAGSSSATGDALEEYSILWMPTGGRKTFASQYRREAKGTIGGRPKSQARLNSRAVPSHSPGRKKQALTSVHAYLSLIEAFGWPTDRPCPFAIYSIASKSTCDEHHVLRPNDSTGAVRAGLAPPCLGPPYPCYCEELYIVEMLDELPRPGILHPDFEDRSRIYLFRLTASEKACLRQRGSEVSWPSLQTARCDGRINDAMMARRYSGHRRQPTPSCPGMSPGTRVRTSSAASRGCYRETRGGREDTFPRRFRPSEFSIPPRFHPECTQRIQQGPDRLRGDGVQEGRPLTSAFKSGYGHRGHRHDLKLQKRHYDVRLREPGR